MNILLQLHVKVINLGFTYLVAFHLEGMWLIPTMRVVIYGNNMTMLQKERAKELIPSQDGHLLFF